MPSGSTQFRYTQTPSKVLHLRNMPWESTEEELVDLCKPFGRVVNTMCNVGANRNQAFVEFVSRPPIPIPPASPAALSRRDLASLLRWMVL
jgi:polypyrimidine tract-binding protein 2